MVANNPMAQLHPAAQIAAVIGGTLIILAFIWVLWQILKQRSD